MFTPVRYEIEMHAGQVGDNDDAVAVVACYLHGDEVFEDRIALMATRTLAEKLVAMLDKEENEDAGS